MRRRAFTLAATLLLARTAPAATIGDDGLHKPDWFAVTFKDVGEDIATAAGEGKRLALLFEQRGCIYCARMHEEILSVPEVRDYLRDNFMIVQFNLHGDEEVVDLDGTRLTEKAAARRWRVLFTPTILFMPDAVPPGGTAADAAVATMPGAFGRLTFLHMFQWVREQGYRRGEHFQAWHARRLAERRAQGEPLGK